MSENISYQGVLLDEYVTYVNADEGELTGLEFNFQKYIVTLLYTDGRNNLIAILR